MIYVFVLATKGEFKIISLQQSDVYTAVDMFQHLKLSKQISATNVGVFRTKSRGKEIE